VAHRIAIMDESAVHDREFTFSTKDFDRVRSFILDETGITLSEGKKNMVYGRLSRRLRQTGLSSFSEYIDFASQDKSDEKVDFINAITTNLTSFFREEHHFEYLKNTVIPQLLKENARTKKIRIWSAGCSTGEEPYSIAMALYESIPNIENWDVKILATDLDTNVLAHGRTGIYDEERITGLNKTRTKTWFLKGKGAHAGSVRVDQRLKSLITFNQLNLMKEWPIKGQFDFMFCRNVIIYFEKSTQRILFDRYADLLIDNAHLFLGHSESLYKVSDKFNLIGNTIYQKN